MGIKISQAFPSKWLKAEDIPKGKRVRCNIERTEVEKAGDDEKPVVYFHGKEKGLMLNKTNANRIADVYGDDTDDWDGKEVFLYQEQVAYQGRMVPSIRVDVPRAEVADDSEAPF